MVRRPRHLPTWVDADYPVLESVEGEGELGRWEGLCNEMLCVYRTGAMVPLLGFHSRGTNGFVCWAKEGRVAGQSRARTPLTLRFGLFSFDAPSNSNIPSSAGELAMSEAVFDNAGGVMHRAGSCRE